MLKARIEVVLSLVLAAATILTAVWPDWIEDVLGFDPDGGNGSVEWLIVAGLAVVTLVVAVLARRDLRALRHHTATGAS
jgi:hypothetical protein